MATTYDKIYVCNLAASKLNDLTATTFEATGGKYESPTARRCDTVFTQAKIQILRSHSWNFATKQAELTQKTATVTITGATQANPVVITATNTFEGAETVTIAGVVGMTELNGNSYIVANPTSTTFELSGIDGTGFTAYTSGGTGTYDDVPDFGDYTYSYPLPTDFVRTIAEDDNKDYYKKVGTDLFTRKSTAKLWYVHEVTDNTFADAMFVNALATLIASKVAPSSKGTQTAMELLDQYKRIDLPEAKAADDIENKEIYRRDQGNWLKSRYSNMGVGGVL